MEKLTVEELKKYYEEMNSAFLVKHADTIKAIAIKNNVDLGVGADMLKAVARGNETYAEGIDFDLEVVKKEYIELETVSKLIVDLYGNV